MSFWRVAAGVATGGLSETLLPGVSGPIAGKTLKTGVDAIGKVLPGPATVPNPNFDSSQLGATTMMPNPAFQQWLGKKMALQAQMAGAFANPARKAEIQAQIDALGPAPPQQIPNELGRRVNEADAAGSDIRNRIREKGDQIVETGAYAFDQGQNEAAIAKAKADAAAGRAAPQLNTSQADRARAEQEATLARLRGFNPNTSGLNALRAFAQQPSGPSVAEAQLRMQAARDRRAAVSLARSARGGPGAVAQAMRTAQAEGAAISAETRGQGAILRATEEAQRRGESLSALTAVASGEATADQARLGALTQEGNLITQTRGGDIEVARENLSSELQTMGLNDTQVRFFNDLSERARQASIDAYIDAQSRGVNAELAAEQAAFAYTQLAWNMLTTEQQAQLQMQAIQAGVDWNNAQAQNAFKQQVFGFAALGITTAATVFGGPAAGVGANAAMNAVQPTQVPNQTTGYTGGGNPYGSGYR